MRSPNPYRGLSPKGGHISLGVIISPVASKVCVPLCEVLKLVRDILERLKYGYRNQNKTNGTSYRRAKTRIY